MIAVLLYTSLNNPQFGPRDPNGLTFYSGGVPERIF